MTIEIIRNLQLIENFKSILGMSFHTFACGLPNKKRMIGIFIPLEENVFGVVAEIMSNYVGEYGDSDSAEIADIFKHAETLLKKEGTIMSFPSVLWLETWDYEQEDGEKWA